MLQDAPKDVPSEAGQADGVGRGPIDLADRRPPSRTRSENSHQRTTRYVATTVPWSEVQDCSTSSAT